MVLLPDEAIEYGTLMDRQELFAYEVDDERGFLSAADPLERLPEDFGPWEDEEWFVLVHVDIEAKAAPAYNECIRWSERFRETHLGYAANYIERQTQTSPGNPTAYGTAATPFMTYLEKHRQGTGEHLL